MKYERLRPENLKFLGRNYKVMWVPDLEENLGLTQHDHLVIQVLDNQIPIEEADTLLHEALHVMWHFMGLSADLEHNLEERVVRALGTALPLLFKENPQLLDYLKAILKEAD